MADKKSILVDDVYCVGGTPKYTYVPRDTLKLESRLKGYLDNPSRLMSIVGASKSGKTVLVEKMFNLQSIDARIWFDGGEIKSFDQFITSLLTKAGAHFEKERTNSTENSMTHGRQLKTGVDIVVFNGGVDSNRESTSGSITSSKTVKDSDPIARATNFLDESKFPLVIDDFHHLNKDLQMEIVRFLKGRVNRKVPIILLAVPNRAYDAVRVEDEMEGRLEVIRIKPWQESELYEIAVNGESYLGIKFDPDAIDRLIGESFGNPLLMQDLLNTLCKEKGVFRTEKQNKRISSPDSWESFFCDKAESLGRGKYERIRNGPEGTDPTTKVLKTGKRVTEYDALLRAISHFISSPALDYQLDTKVAIADIRASWGHVVGPMPPRLYFEQLLVNLHNIAFSMSESPILEWEAESLYLVIHNPYFAFTLKWGLLD